MSTRIEELKEWGCLSLVVPGILLIGLAIGGFEGLKAFALILGLLAVGLIVFFTVDAVRMRRGLRCLRTNAQKGEEIVRTLWNNVADNIGERTAEVAILLYYALICEDRFKNWMRARLSSALPYLRHNQKPIEEVRLLLQSGEVQFSEVFPNDFRYHDYSSYRKAMDELASKPLLKDQINIETTHEMYEHESVIKALRDANKLLYSAWYLANSDVKSAREHKRRYKEFIEKLEGVFRTLSKREAISIDTAVNIRSRIEGIMEQAHVVARQSW